MHTKTFQSELMTTEQRGSFLGVPLRSLCAWRQKPCTGPPRIGSANTFGTDVARWTSGWSLVVRRRLSEGTMGRGNILVFTSRGGAVISHLRAGQWF